MSEGAVTTPIVRPLRVETVYAVAIFASAALIFLLEPMVGRMLTPALGGSPAVWNTSLAFFQIALLAGYFYAHILQKLPSVRWQAGVHVGLLALAALALPLRISGLLGPPPLDGPILWLLGVLTVSIGAPFAVLSATAPLLQAWFAHGTGHPPYRLYAASNLGSLLALGAYSTLVEPFAGLSAQTLAWSLGYGGFALLVAGLAFGLRAQPASVAAGAPIAAPKVSTNWRERCA
jgi:hypothetical protein